MFAQCSTPEGIGAIGTRGTTSARVTRASAQRPKASELSEPTWRTARLSSPSSAQRPKASELSEPHPSEITSQQAHAVDRINDVARTCDGLDSSPGTSWEVIELTSLPPLQALHSTFNQQKSSETRTYDPLAESGPSPVFDA